MILIVKGYEPDYGNDNECGCDTGTTTIEAVLELDTDLSEQELVVEYDRKLCEMAKLRKDYKSTTKKTTLDRWKYAEGYKYSFLKFVMGSYNFQKVDFIEVRE